MSKPKIILYNPKAVFYDMPLALMAIASNINREKYEVVIIDGRLHKNPIPEILKHLENAICFGVTVLTGSPLKDAIEVTSSIKKISPNLLTIWGGWHPSLFATEILNDTPSVDITVQGQGETTFVEILNKIDSKELSKIKGICFRDIEGRVIKNAGRALEPMDNFKPIDYSLIDVEAYFKLKGKRQLDYISSTGCYFRCTFCADPFVFNRNFSALSPERIVEELKDLYDKYQLTDINFQDETFFTYPKRIAKIAEGFIDNKMNVSWAGTMRADQGYRMSEEQFKLCVDSGLRRVLIGVESGSQEMMDWLSKDIKKEHVYFCAERCKKYGVGVIFPFIVGFPGESDQSIVATRNMAKDLQKMSLSFETPIFYFKPYPGSKITDDVVKDGYQLPSSTQQWGDFDYIGSKGPWVSKEKYAFFEKFKFYIKAAYQNKKKWMWPIQQMARLRCRYHFYGFPFEKKLYNWLVKEQKLS